MKKYLTLFLVGIIFLSSCSDLNKIKDTAKIKDVKKFTTLAIQNLQKDTVVISIVEDKLYIFNDSNEVVFNIINIDSDNYIRLHKAMLFILVTIIAMLFIFITTEI
ncbi:MAG: hypothetical protein GY775_16895 [Candidatus Scalindua sp.]|nr:hypothetical protein [Candidatus Scalindua sp.]